MKLPEPDITSALVFDDVGRQVPMRLVGAFYSKNQMTKAHKQYNDLMTAKDRTERKYLLLRKECVKCWVKAESIEQIDEALEAEIGRAG